MGKSRAFGTMRKHRRAPKVDADRLVGLMRSTGVLSPATMMHVLHAEAVPAESVMNLILALGIPTADAIRTCVLSTPIDSTGSSIDSKDQVLEVDDGGWRNCERCFSLIVPRSTAVATA